MEQKFQRRVWIPPVQNAAREKQGINYPPPSVQRRIWLKSGRSWFKKRCAPASLRREFPITRVFGPVPHLAPRGDAEAELAPGVAQGAAHPQSAESALPTGQALQHRRFKITNGEKAAGWRLHPRCDSSWKIPAELFPPVPGQNAGEHHLEGMPQDPHPRTTARLQVGKAAFHTARGLDLSNPKGQLYGLSAHECHRHLYFINAERIQDL